jgi:hypothetical protein
MRLARLPFPLLLLLFTLPGRDKPRPSPRHAHWHARRCARFRCPSRSHIRVNSSEASIARLGRVAIEHVYRIER